MKSLHSYSAVLDSIFNQIEEETKIVIDFTVGHGQPSATGTDDFIINSVNGFATPAEFNHHIEYLAAEITARANTTAQGLPAGVQQLFMKEVVNRFRLLRHITRFERFPTINLNSEGLWLFNHPAFNGCDIKAIPTYALNQVVLRVSPYALNWKIVICYAEQRLKYILWSYEYFADKFTTEAKDKEVKRKLPLRIPVPQLACFFLGCVDTGIIKTETKQELFRITADVCQTPNAPDISPKSFRNHFDFPNPEVIKTTIVDLQRVIQALRDKLRGIEGSAMLVLNVMNVMMASLVMNVMDWIDVMA